MSTQTFYHLQSIETELKQQYPWFDMSFLETKCFLSYLAFMAVISKYYRLYGGTDLLEVISNYREGFFNDM